VADPVELEARISAMELVLVTQILQSGISTPGFDPRAFAAGRREAWTAIGKATCESCTSDVEEKQFAGAYASALERLGHLLVTLAEPVQEAIDEVEGIRAGSSAQQEAAGKSGAQSPGA
jgi:hypothetical protein